MRILIVSYYFPPANYIASLRVGKWAKYLERAGIETWVLTLESGMFPSAGVLPVEITHERVIRAGMGRRLTGILKKRQMKRETVPQGTNARVSGGKPALSTLLFQTESWVTPIWRQFSKQFSDVRFPDRAFPWVVPAIRQGHNLLKSLSFDVILSSHGPPSSHLVASALAGKRHLAWIADYRDLWSLNHVARRSGFVQNWELSFEKRVLRHAKALITVSTPLAEELRMLHNKPVYVIPNGFDEEDYVAIKSKDKLQNNPGILRIVYTGTIYPGKRDPSRLFEAMAFLRNRTEQAGFDIHVHFIGVEPQFVTPAASRYGVQAQVFCHPRCSYYESLHWQMSGDVLLLLEWLDPSAKGVYTGKIFEYLGARRPILCIGPSGGVIDDLLRKTKAGCLMNDSQAIATWLSSIFETKRQLGSIRMSYDNETLTEYSRSDQAQHLAALLRSVTAGLPC